MQQRPTELEPSSPGAPDLSRRVSAVLVATGILVFSLLASAASIGLHWRFDQINPLDKAYFLQRAWQAAFGIAPCRTLLATESGAGLWAGKHLDPILGLFVPLVRWWPSMEALLAGQAVVLALGAVPAYTLAETATGDRRTAVLAAWAWLTLPLVWSMAVTDFRTFSLAAPFMLACWAAALRGRVGWSLFWCLAALACREEVAWFMLAALPALAWETRRLPGARAGAGLLLLTILAWLGLVTTALGGFSPFVDFSDTLQRMARDTSHLLPLARAAQGHPARALEVLTYQVHATGPALIAVLLAPLRAAPALLNWLTACYAEGLATPESFHYLAPTAAAVAFAWSSGLTRAAHIAASTIRLLATRRSDTPADRDPDSRSAGQGHGRPAPGPVPARIAAGTLLLANLAVLHHTPPPGLDSAPRVLTGTMRPETRTDSAWPLILRIPNDAPVLTDDMFVSALANRLVIFDADEIRSSRDRRTVIDSVSWALLRDGSPWVDDLEANGFRQVGQSGGATLLVRTAGVPMSWPSLCFR